MVGRCKICTMVLLPTKLILNSGDFAPQWLSRCRLTKGANKPVGHQGQGFDDVATGQLGIERNLKYQKHRKRR